MKKLISTTAMFVALAVLAMPALARPPFMVVGTMDPATDIANVQHAVDNYEKVRLRGSFNFGRDGVNDPPTNRVVITNDVKICGETDEAGMPMTTIYGGFWTFYAPLPPAAFFGSPFEPGPEITIKNISFDGAMWAPIYISHTSGVEIKNIRIINVLPVGPFEIFGRPDSYWQGGIYLLTMFDDPRNVIPGLEPAVVPNAITGPIVIKDNEVDLEVYPPYPPRSPEDTMGQAVFVVWSWGAMVDIKSNTVRNVSRNSIELLNNYKDDDGNGSITVKDNNIITAEVGINVPSNGTPNGIVTGWSNDPGASPERTPEFTIKGNHVEGKGETSAGVVIISAPATVKKNYITVKDGWIVDSGASGIVIWGEGAVVSENEITINPTTGIPGAAGSGILIVSDYATVKENEILFDDVVPSAAFGILQLASEGMISSNRIEGLGNVAVFLQPGPGPAVQNNVISNNDIEDFTFITGGADVVFRGGANYNTLVGEGGTVFDLGIGNVITGNWEILP